MSAGRGDGLPLLGLLGVAAALRVVAWQRTVVLFNDGPVFLAMAEAIRAGRVGPVVAHPYHPLYPAATALAAGLGLPLESAAVAVSIAGGVLSVAAIFFFVREHFDRQAAWLAAWLVAVHPWAIDFSSDVMSDGLYAGLHLVSFAAMASLVERPRPAAAAVCGLAGGLAYLVRPEGLGLPLLAAGGLGVRWLAAPDRRRLTRRVVGALAVLLVAAALCVGPWITAVAAETGELALTRKKSLATLAFGANARVEEGAAASAPDPIPTSHMPVPTGAPAPSPAPEASRGSGSGAEPGALPWPAFAETVAGPGAARPKRDLAGALETVSRVLRTSLAAFRYELLPFVLGGLLVLRRREGGLGRREAIVLAPIVAYGAVLVLLVWGAGYVSRRHALASWLPAVAYAAVGWRAGWTQIVGRLVGPRDGGGDRARAVAPATGVVLALVLVLALVWGPRDLRLRRADRAGLREAAEWLARNHPSSGGVAAQKQRIAYYAHAPFVPLSAGLEGALEGRLREQGARWVVIERARLGDHLGLEAGLGGWLRPVHRVPAAPDGAGVRGEVLVLEIAD
ncbi:MAG: glycosyltransferase family 39 protein [Spirochaetaceae bacterium]|nr:glycosyltransferase family 39 protein [Myxococcales bacterium]MCB9722868.1 glycosyltransferase family 39 protein [Spirochaetaceae bacterium]